MARVSTSWDDQRCVLSVNFARDTLPALKAMLEFGNATHAGCRVIKHPGACAICVANNDCAKIPLHVQCRCKPEPYLTAMDG